MKKILCKRDPEGTRRRILKAAVEEFVTGGLSGARVDRIARLAEANERMIYYYYGCKEQLFVAVLEHTLCEFTSELESLDVSAMKPVDAIMCYANFIWQYYLKNPRLVRLVNTENLHQARYWRMARIPSMVTEPNERIASLLEAGVSSGAIRAGIDPIHLLLTISALGYYVVSNRFTLEASLGRDMTAPQHYAGLMEFNTRMLMHYLLPQGTPLPDVLPDLQQTSLGAKLPDADADRPTGA